MAVPIGLRKYRILPPEGPRFEVDEAAVLRSWVGEDGKKKVVLKGTGGQVFEVDEEVLLVAEGGRKEVKFKSSDGVLFSVEEAVAKQSPTIMFVVQAHCCRSDDGVPVLKVGSKILGRVLEYCSMHAVHRSFFVSEAAADELKNWDADFVKVDPATLRGLMMAAYELNMDGLLELACQAFGDMMKGKTAEEIRKMFGIKNDFTPKHEEWAPPILQEQAKSSRNAPLHTRRWF